MKASGPQGNPVQGYQLTFFTSQDHRHRGKCVAEWLVDQARAMGIGGATMIGGNEGFGHHRRLHKVHLVDVHEQPMEVIMAVTADEADRLLSKVTAEHVKVFYSKSPVEFGMLGEDK